ncbi:PQQ-dependent sugar dehydrogenase [Polymorphospora rubra]|uniref:PQQ-dependent sugar dehydrogenase n=1 Tax=Polymorphospora rubra TaxID=338584 RepID=UPI003407BDEC
MRIVRTTSYAAALLAAVMVLTSAAPTSAAPAHDPGNSPGGGASILAVPQTPTTLTSGLTIPWDVCWLPGGAAALVTERNSGRVYRLTPAGVRTLLGTVPGVLAGGEGGLLGCAVSPTWNGGTDRDVFFMHTSSSDNRVVRMAYTGGSSLTAGSTPILTGIVRASTHNGGRLKFGPDGNLYVTTGDAQQTNLAQNPSSLNGKILRITRTGAAAPGNPTAGSRVYSLGHRNPQGISWDSAGRLWAAEFGQNTWDEINLILPGRNYGWPVCEGTCGNPAYESPKWQRSTAECSCSGLAIVDGAIYLGALRGQRLWRLELSGTSVVASAAYWQGTYGRIRAVEKVPGTNAIWFTTSNGNGTDTVRRAAIA